jgi:hypothetical protein
MSERGFHRARRPAPRAPDDCAVAAPRRGAIPSFTNAASLWERSFRLNVDASRDEAVKDFARRASQDMLPFLKR